MVALVRLECQNTRLNNLVTLSILNFLNPTGRSARIVCRRMVCVNFIIAEIGVVESAKAATELYSPVSGCVKETNATIERKPSLLNKYVANDGWTVLMVFRTP